MHTAFVPMCIHCLCNIDCSEVVLFENSAVFSALAYPRLSLMVTNFLLPMWGSCSPLGTPVFYDSSDNDKKSNG